MSNSLLLCANKNTHHIGWMDSPTVTNSKYFLEVLSQWSKVSSFLTLVFPSIDRNLRKTFSKPDFNGSDIFLEILIREEWCNCSSNTKCSLPPRGALSTLISLITL